MKKRFLSVLLAMLMVLSIVTILPITASADGGSEPTHDKVQLWDNGPYFATMNLGATKPEENGDYFAWGETEPYYSSQDPLTWKTGKENGYSWSTYCGQSSFTEWSTLPYDATTKQLKPEYDAATQNWGDDWRMPTNQEYQDMLYNCYIEWTSDYKGTGKDGFIVYKVDASKGGKGVYVSGSTVKTIAPPAADYTDGGSAPSGYSTSDVHIFFPAASNYSSNSNIFLSIKGRVYYWSNTLNSEDQQTAEFFQLSTSPKCPDVGPQIRYTGFPVRAVYTPVTYAITNGTATGANGTISFDKTTAKEGDTVTVTVVPDEGYKLTSLKYNDGSDHEITKDTTSGEYQFAMPSKAVTVTAGFELIPHTHTGTKQNVVEASKKAAGCKEYFLCDCGKAFEDEECTKEIENLDTWKAEGGDGYIAPNGGDKGGANLTWLWILLGILLLLIVIYVVVFFIWKKKEELPDALAFLGFLVPSYKAINNALFKKEEKQE